MSSVRHPMRTVHIVPWDAGRIMTKSARSKVEESLRRLGWRFLYNSDYCRVGTQIAYRRCQGTQVTLDLFSDGICVFSIHDKAQRWVDITDFDPFALTSRKTHYHNKILLRTHRLSRDITAAMKAIWACTPERRRRPQARDTWESLGLSYVFTFYFIRTDPLTLRRSTTRSRCTALLFPLPVTTIESDPQIDQLSSIEEHATQFSSELLRSCTIADGPSMKLFFSWATSLLIGSTSLPRYLRYCKTMRELQHAWFGAYVGDQQLNSVVDELSKKHRLSELTKLDSQMSRIAREASRFMSISDSMATGFERRIYFVAAKQSGLRDLIASIKAKFEFVRNEMSSRIELRQLHSHRLLEALILLLTAIQALSAYKSITQAGGLTAREAFVSIGSLVVLLVVLLARWGGT